MKKLIILLSLITLSCSNDKDVTNTPPILTEEVLTYNHEKINNDLLLVNDAANDEVYLLKKNGEKFHEWTLSNEIGNDVTLEDDGNLLALLKTDNDQITFGGHGGKIQRINPDSKIDWEFTYSTSEYNLHHDIEKLPNGNILALLWEKKTNLEAKEKGYKGDEDLFIESIIEINPKTNNIVWKWSSWNHTVQNIDNTKLNYASISNNPQLIDINYNSSTNGDIMHANAIEYDSKNDLIFISVNFYSEIWVIDHSTTTEEATTNSGGNYNKGGNLIYRFGNPSSYKGDGKRLFYNNHHCNFIKNDLPGGGNMLVFNNGTNNNLSSVFELKLPTTFDFKTPPSIIWLYENPELYFAKVSGAVRTKNGNTLITEGDFGYWEVTENKEVVWQYSKSGFFWRGYPYEYNSEAITNLKK